MGDDYCAFISSPRSIIYLSQTTITTVCTTSLQHTLVSREGAKYKAKPQAPQNHHFTRHTKKGKAYLFHFHFHSFYAFFSLLPTSPPYTPHTRPSPQPAPSTPPSVHPSPSPSHHLSTSIPTHSYIIHPQFIPAEQKKTTTTPSPKKSNKGSFKRPKNNAC